MTPPEPDTRNSPADVALKTAAGGILMLIPGLLGYAIGYPLLFPSLGPTAFLHAVSPHEKSARFINTFVGHLVGIAAGYFAVWACLATHAPSVFAAEHLVLSRVLASALAVALTVLLQLLSKTEHPPAAATTLLITLGGMKPAWKDFFVLIAGIALATLAGEIARHLLLRRKPAQRLP